MEICIRKYVVYVVLNENFRSCAVDELNVSEHGVRDDVIRFFSVLTTRTQATMSSEKNAQLNQAREDFQMIYQISQLLRTGLDQETLSTCIKLCELGVNPEVLAHIIKEIRKMGENAVENRTGNL
ncbi:hypothetical protein K1T71_006873 [Dendrolimus kikuchii]|uniref:Uncharacterized protein n=1 Tax=Dendrolimus kikuchii TaxID=765133 RepID=A0ACC1D2F5_9NEOP|nr:hypothetical protein K1T71_006873 [Dendrolimus kikuchii]